MALLNDTLSLTKICGLATCFVGLNFSLSVLSAQAQTRIEQATITEILDGTEVFIQGNQAQVGDQATFGQRVSTGNARTQLRFNTNAVGRLSTNSVLTIGQCADLNQGSVLINGAIDGCTTSIVAGVRGTTYIVSIDETGQESVTVLEGDVSLQRQPSSDAAELSSESVNLTAGQTVAISEAGPLGLVESLSVEDFSRLLEGVLFSGFAEELPGIQAIRQSFERLYPGAVFPEAPALPNPASDSPNDFPATPSAPRF